MVDADAHAAQGGGVVNRQDDLVPVQFVGGTRTEPAGERLPDCSDCHRLPCVCDDGTRASILEMLRRAPSCQLNQTSMAAKLGRKPSTLNPTLGVLVREGLIDRAYRNVGEKTSAITYQLTSAGRAAMGV